MPIHLNNKSGTQLYHRSGDTSSKKYSIFGENGVMNYAYVTTSDEERNNRGLYTTPIKKPEYLNDDIIQLDSKNHVLTLSKQVSLSQREEIDVEQSAEKVIDDAVEQHVITSKNKLCSREFVWPYGGKNVFLTGTFDDWQASIPMTPVSTTNVHNNLFHVTVNDLDFSKDMHYKFVVDGEWCYDLKKDHITEISGNINNIIYANITSS